ncbi:hypothetical protein ANT2_0755 [plant metagenome]|uniref:Uncharacterized protein n=1 Tax=plant metagenome TaxID=1297885 RepID=A0A484R3N3_9ZZZZ
MHCFPPASSVERVAPLAHPSLFPRSHAPRCVFTGSPRVWQRMGREG